MESTYEPLIGIWVKARPEYIRTFIRNWETTKNTQAFCVYDLPPMLPKGGVVFLHAINLNRLIAYARYVGYEYIKGWYDHVELGNDQVWMEERDRIWNTFGPYRLHTHNKEEFDEFWKAQKGVRGLFLMESVKELPEKIPWSKSMRILQIHRPIGFSYRYLTFKQVQEFLKLTRLKVFIEVRGISNPEVVLKETS